MVDATDYVPKVSVAVITFRHARFIVDCLQSVLAQVVDFPIEIVIGDDGSDDGSQELIREFADRNRGRADFRLRLSSENQGNFSNVFDLLSSCRGEYVALLEGDDRWCHQGKLQQQIDLLDSNPRYAGSFHDAEIRNDSFTEEKRNSVYKTLFRRYSQIHRYTPEVCAWQLARRVLIPTSALVYRNGAYLDALRTYSDLKVSLGEVHKLLIAKQGPFHYRDEVWAIYNNHEGGVTKQRPRDEFFRAHRRIYRSLLHDEFYSDYQSHLYATLEQIHLDRFWAARTSDEGRSAAVALEVVRYGVLRAIASGRELMRALPPFVHRTDSASVASGKTPGAERDRGGS